MRPIYARLAALTVLMAIQIALVGGAAAHGVTLKVHHFLPADSAFHTQFLLPWAAKLEKESAGHLRLQVFPAMGLGGAPAQLYDQVKDRTADIVWTAIDFTPGRFPALEVFELPFLVNSAQGSSRALWRYVQANNLARTELDGVRVLAVHHQAAPQFQLQSKPVASLADLSGMKIRAPGPIAGKLLAALGAAPVELPLADVSGALAKGALDGALLPWDAPATRESIKYYAELDPASPWLYSSVFLLAMNAASYQALSDDLKQVMRAASGPDTCAALAKVFEDSQPSARKQALERGQKVNLLSREELKNWQKAAQGVTGDWIKTLDQSGLDGKALVDSARELVAEHDAPSAGK